MAAATGPLPIKFAEVVNLKTLGIDETNIAFKNISVQSSRFVTVREEAANSVAVVDTAGKRVNKYPAKGIDSAIMHPSARVIGFRAGNNLQIFNLEMKTRVKAAILPETALFWKWIDAKTVGIVGESGVYHWSMDAAAGDPEKKFDRAAYGAPVQILNYHASPDHKWLMLQGIASNGSGGFAGVLQLFSAERGASQPTIDATAACFANVQLEGRDAPSLLFCFVANSPAGPKLSVIELGAPKESALKVTGDLKFATPDDFALSMHVDEKHGTVFLVSKTGYLFLFEITTCKCLFAKRVSSATMFATITHEETGGIMTVDQSGRVIAISLDTENLVNYVRTQLRDHDLGMLYALKYKMSGARDIFQQQFERAVAMGNVPEAVRIAAEAPDNALRNRDTIRSLASLPGAPPPVLQYFSHVLKTGKLLDFESVELAKLIVASGNPAGRKHITDWIQQDKLTYTDELGDVLRVYDVKLACGVYIRCESHEKAIGCLVQLGEFDRMFEYATQKRYTPNWPILLQQLHHFNREKSREFASMLARRIPPMVDVNQVIDIFMASNDAESTTAFLLDVLGERGDRPEDAELQTRLLEIALSHSPQVADALFDSESFKLTHFDHLRIAQMCERVRLFNRALEFYEDLEDRKRVLIVGLNTGMISPEFVLNFFGNLTADAAIECLRELLNVNLAGNIRLVIEIAKKYTDVLGPQSLIDVFEEFEADTGVYYYLGSFVNFSQDSKIIFKYIQSGVKLQQFKEVERVCRDNDYYDAAEVKEYLLSSNLKDPRPLIHVCDRHGFVEELTRYLFQNQMFAFIEAYAQKMNQGAVPGVVAALLDLNCEDERIKSLLAGVKPPACPVGQLLDEMVKRNRLRLLLPWLEALRTTGSEDTEVHNGLAMCYVEMNASPTHFLLNNKFYDSKVVGKFCESRDPHLAFVAYKRAGGSCDLELIEVTNKNGFFRDQAKYLVERQNPDLWKIVLSPDNPFRRSLIDQVVASALPESRVAEEITCTVKAFRDANLPNELMELLEKIVLHGSSDSEFKRNKNLQNLLILIAMKAEPGRVMDYINRLDNYDGPEIAKLAITDEYKLYEEAFFIYKKFQLGEDAIKVLLSCIRDMERAVEFANYWDKPPVWGILGRSQLDHAMTKEAIESFIKADDVSAYKEVIIAVNRDGFFKELIPFLNLARTKVRDAAIDNELLYAHAKTGDLASLEDFVNSPHIAKVELVGDRVFAEKLWDAARILYDFVKNYAKLAICYVYLKEFQAAVDAARKANNINTWKIVCFACVDAGEFRLAQVCGVNIIVIMDQLNELVKHYETGGHFEPLIALLEQGINLDRAHPGIFTQLGICYAKYKEEKLMEHIKLFWSRLNIQILLTACRQNCHWKEVVFLLTHYDQYEPAVDTMIEHSSECWEHDLFKTVVKQTPSTEVYYRTISFYLQEHPLLLNDLLIELSAKLDHSRVVNQLKRTDYMALIQKYLLFVQRDNNVDVNTALNQLFLEAEDHKSLRESIDNYPAFDQVALAQKLQNHELLEFRRIAAHLYKMNKRYETSIELSKKDAVFADVISTASDSGDSKIAEGTLAYFIQKGQHACFAASLYACYSLINADVVLELAWRHNLYEMVMPFMIQVFRDVNDRIKSLEDKFAAQDKKLEDEEEAERKAKEAEADKAAKFVSSVPLLGPPMGMNAPLALPAPPGMFPPPPGMYGGGMYPAPGFGGGFGGY